MNCVFSKLINICMKSEYSTKFNTSFAFVINHLSKIIRFSKNIELRKQL